MILIDEIRDMIAKGETEKSLDELYKYVKENNADIIDNLVMLKSRMQRLQSQKLNGTIDNEDEAIEQAKINEAILKLLHQVTPEYLARARQYIKPVNQVFVAEKAPVTSSRNKKKIYIIGGALLLAVILIIINSVVSSEKAVAEESLSATEGTLLDNVLAAHGGYAVWATVPNEADKQSIFVMENDESWQEIENNQVKHTFKIVKSTSDYVILYDEERQLFLQIRETYAQFQTEGEDTWKDAYQGEWITPSNAQ